MVYDTPSESYWQPILLAVSTDACKGLENAVKDVFPHAEQRDCFRHMMQNYVKRFPGGAEHMYPAARAYKKVVHDHHLALVREKLDVCYWLCRSMMTLPPAPLLEQPTVVHCWRG
jgi:hypothetical protein